MRALVITNMFPGPRNPAFGVFVKRQVEALREIGCDVVLVENTEDRSGWRNAVKYASLLARTRRAARAGGFDIVVGHYLYPTAAFARIASAMSGRPYVLVAHGSDVTALAGREDKLARDARGALDRAAAVVAVSGALERRLREELQLSGRVPVPVVHMGVDTRAFCLDSGARAGLEWPADDRIALFVGNLVPVKGPDIALEAFIEAYSDGVLDRLVLVGDGPMSAQLAERARETGVADAVYFAGRQPSEKVAACMAAADVLVISSRNEGLGLVALEALACGTPVVATRVGGLPEIMPRPPCGHLVPAEDPHALARAMAGALSVPEERIGDLPDRCRAVALPHDVLQQAKAFLGVLEQVLGQ